MEVFESESLKSFSGNRRINHFKLGSVLILITIIVLFLINIVILGTILYNNDTETIYQDLNKTNNNIWKNIEALNKKFNENNNDINERIRALETSLTSFTKDNVIIQNMQRELSQTIDAKMKNMENKEETVNKTLNADEIYNATIVIVQKEFNNSINKIEKTVEKQKQSTLDMVKETITKVNDKIENFEEMLELQLHKVKVYNFEQNASCLDTMHRTTNEDLGRSKYVYILKIFNSLNSNCENSF